MKGITVNLTLFFLFMTFGTLVHAQYVNTDSLVIVPGIEQPLTIIQVGQMNLSTSGPAFHKNRSTGDLLLQFTFPGEGKVISPFGVRSGRMHTGTDVKMAKGDTVYAAFNGSVTCSRYHYGYGNLVILQHGKSLETYYGHLSKILVHSGDWVKRGEPVGLAGATGRATTSHLHFEVRENDIPCDPELVFDFENGAMKNEIGSIESLAALNQVRGKNNYSVNEPLSQKYIVRSGDSLWKISRRAKTSIQTLCHLNNLSESTVLRVGQVLKVY